MASDHLPVIPLSALTRDKARDEARIAPRAAGSAAPHTQSDATLTAPTASASKAGPAADPGQPRVYVETYGCQMNVADTALFTGILAEEGYGKASRPEDADVIIINTCAVRERAEERVYARAQELRSHKRKRPDTVLSIVGCMAEHLKERLLERAPYIDIIAGPDSYRRMPAMIAKARIGRAIATDPISHAAIDVRLDKAETYEGLSGALGGDGVSGFVTIQRGCDKFCTFCVVPFTRGRERGAVPREILRQVRAHAEAGYREAVLLGQTVNSYRYEDVGFAELLYAVAQVDGIERIRFTSPYPVDFRDDVIDAIATLDKVCKYVHLPVQSGSDAVLERMRRGYTVADFRAIVHGLRSKMPDIAISTDILTGFCGESEDEHARTLALMEEIRFDSAFMFQYSERDLTTAAKKMTDDVTPEVKKRRLREIIALQEQISRQVFAAQVGKRERVLIHGPSKRNPEEMVGRTDGFKSVIVSGIAPAHGAESSNGGPAERLQAGQFVDVRIERATMATLFGRPL